jgi:hypothetical protein
MLDCDDERFLTCFSELGQHWDIDNVLYYLRTPESLSTFVSTQRLHRSRSRVSKGMFPLLVRECSHHFVSGQTIGLGVSLLVVYG